MPQYRYKALNAHGELFDGQMEAASEAEVAARLQDQGHMPMEARLASEGVAGASSWLALLRRKPFDGGALVQFTQQLATLLGAGQPLDRALSILLELPEDERTRRVITDIRDIVRGGAPLSTALERQHGLFSRLYINMVRAGEAGGSLHDTLQRLSDYLERSAELKGRVINALIYPAILLVVVGGALLFLLGYVVPQFALMYESLDVALPWFTQWVLTAGLVVREGWVIMIVVPAVIALVVERRLRQPAARLAVDGWLLQRKGIGPLLGKLETARLARTLGTLLRNGVPLLSGLGIARNVLSNRALAADVDAASDEVKNGNGLSASLSRGKRFPRLALQMIQVGEESGALDTMLLKTADTFEQESARAIDRLLSALVPVITLVLASVVGLVIVAVLVPLYDLTNAIG
ncbi:type II secretion system protein GspF [Stenotrophomonas sp. HMSC10F06]|jgi:general secretion pathway protein F|uniref:type II secretion system protein XpsF n=1 Tax=Stenotrophomonas TaxID=40323 RepID=UPI0008A16F52|nr:MULTISPECIES: type II secretion system F family protein [Stenotrophomonas]MDX5516368.1 type II secretion system F family protein [Stenotrophomonas sp. RG-453]OFS94477.1 type II secretion system protein GspF [Stenotrophomonas sp. HMSC10F06]WIA60673.1 type II secretion system F family protein [Stenotrophomonas sp. BIO128-Bstrain]